MMSREQTFSARAPFVASPKNSGRPASARYVDRPIMPPRFGGAGNRPVVSDPRPRVQPPSPPQERKLQDQSKSRGR